MCSHSKKTYLTPTNIFTMLKFQFFLFFLLINCSCRALIAKELPDFNARLSEFNIDPSLICINWSLALLVALSFFFVWFFSDCLIFIPSPSSLSSCVCCESSNLLILDCVISCLSTSLYVSRFLTAFSSVAPFHTLCRIWDFFFFEGSMVGSF